MCGLYSIVCVAGAPMCITDKKKIVCGGILGHSDVLFGPPVFLLGGIFYLFNSISSGWASDFWPQQYIVRMIQKSGYTKGCKGLQLQTHNAEDSTPIHTSFSSGSTSGLGSTIR